MKQAIHTGNAPAAAGPYSQAMRAGDFLFVSGQIALVSGTKELRGSRAGEQAAQALDNLKAVVEAAGLTMKDVVKTTVILADIQDFAAVNEVYGKYFDSEYPARAAFQGGGLPLGALVEIEAVAYYGKK
ncbi:MAG TPA: RidA family protein [Spirochaetota bacterium]|nr:RidA family protein [Spirochaetota bacterium]